MHAGLATFHASKHRGEQVASYCDHGDEPSSSIKCGQFLWSSWGHVSFSGRTLLHGIQFSTSLLSQVCVPWPICQFSVVQFMFYQYVARVFSEWFWDGPICLYIAGNHIPFYLFPTGSVSRPAAPLLLWPSPRYTQSPIPVSAHDRWHVHPASPLLYHRPRHWPARCSPTLRTI
jgi:hypothetical protein